MTKKAKQKYYAVRVGKVPGIYTNWDEANLQVFGLNHCEYKSFKTLALAEEYMSATSETYKHTQPSSQSTSSLVNTKYYAVRVGAKPGVYLTYEESQLQTNSYPGAKYKSFKSLDQARLYVKGWDNPQDWSKYLNNKSVVIDTEDLDTLENYYFRLTKSAPDVDTTQFEFGIAEILSEYNNPDNPSRQNTYKGQHIQTDVFNLFTLTDEERADYMLKGDKEAKEVVDFYNKKEAAQTDEYEIQVAIKKANQQQRNDEQAKQPTTINDTPKTMYKARKRSGSGSERASILDLIGKN